MTRSRCLLLLWPFLLALGAGSAGAATYICFGDSNTAGLTGRAEDAYPWYLGNYLATAAAPATVLNKGVGGEVTTEGADRLGSVLSANPAEWVLIMEGTNDVNVWVNEPARLTPAGTESNLRDMVRTARGRGLQVALGTIIPRVGGAVDSDNSLTRQLNDIVRRVAASEGAVLAEVYGNVAPRANTLTYAGTLHLEPFAYSLVAEAFAAAVTGASVGSIDLTAPLPERIQPTPSSRNVSTAAEISFRVEEDKHPIDPSTATMTVDGAVVSPTVEVNGGEVTFGYTPPAPWRFGQRVEVNLTVRDTNPTANELRYGYSFAVTAGNGSGGDLDRSGRIDGADMAILAESFGADRRDDRYDFAADVDGSGVVDGLDLIVVAARFGAAP